MWDETKQSGPESVYEKRERLRREIEERRLELERLPTRELCDCYNRPAMRMLGNGNVALLGQYHLDPEFIVDWLAKHGIKAEGK